MILTHFHEENWEFSKLYAYIQGTFKPSGLWLSDESVNGWKDWCEAEDFRTDRLEFSTQFTFTEDANILHLSSIEEVKEFHEKWQDDKYRDHPYISQVDWGPVSEAYDGILITPYRRAFTHRMPTWYYGWDVSSACVWNTNVLVEVRAMSNTYELEK